MHCVITGGVDEVVTAIGASEPVDVLVHCAGISAVGRLPSVDLAQQQKVVDLNLTASMVITARLLEADRINAGGSIVFLSSLSHYVGYPGASVYAATKDGIASYARSLRVELKAAGLHVMTVFPGPTRTAHARRYSPDNSREQARMDPDALAERIRAGVERKQSHIVPGLANRVAAFVGSWLPAVTERAMVRSILAPLDATGPADRDRDK